MNIVQNFLLKHAKSILISGLLILLGAGVYGIGLFGVLADANDNFFATGTESSKVNEKVKELFGSADNDTSVILFESKNRSATITTEPYASEISRLLKELKTKTVVSYYTTGAADQFVSKDLHDTYVAVTVEGTNDEQFKALTKFAETAKSDLVKISVGGMLVGKHQTMSQVKDDLAQAELISLPILAVLLFFFFRSPVAAAIPLILSILTILGSLAVARLVGLFVSIDTYTLNVITILSVGLSVDYSLLAVNRFREELDQGLSSHDAAKKTLKTAARTIVFSGATVIICLLALLFFPVGFMRSVSIGGAAAVLVAVIISTVLLPPALKLMGGVINKWSLKRNVSVKGWTRLATGVTKRPIIALLAGVIVISTLVWPVHYFKTQTFDWHVLPSNQSAYYVGKVMSERFEDKTPTLTLLAQFPSEPSVEQLCTLAKTVSAVEGVKAVQGAYAPTKQMNDCTTLARALAYSSAQTMLAQKAANSFVSGSYAKVQIITNYDVNDHRNRDLMNHLENAEYSEGVVISLTGAAAQSLDTLDVYMKWLPYVIGAIAVAMILVLSILLGSVILPIQAVVINSLALFISLGVLIMIFQFGWGASLLCATASGGFELSIPILIFTMAFGLSMDYAVFLYSRMHEVYDLTNDPKEAIIGGVVKTGPIITAAALLMVAVVGAFATSHISLIQQIGIGLVVAVLVDAFFVRIIFVPAIMKLFGHVSWWGPKWLKKMTIKHD